ncbi:MAG TPA: hypothetical protein ENI15_10775, partial [Spirochaetes bacterium]|nr:hypothetical protein [Spirochaetota bacterium]
MSEEQRTYKVRWLFYRAKFEWRSFLKTRKVHLVDDVINVWTCLINLPVVIWEERSLRHPKKWAAGVWQFIKACFSHVEIWTPDADGRFGGKSVDIVGNGKWERTTFSPYLGTCWTSTMRDGMVGTCSRPASEVILHPERWEYIEFEVNEHDYNRGVFWMCRKVKDNKGYSK